MKKLIYIIVFINALRLITLPLMGELEFDQSLLDSNSVIGLIQLLFVKLLGPNTFAIKLPNFIISLFIQFAFYFLVSQIIRSKKRITVLMLFSTTFMITRFSYSIDSFPLLVLLWILSMDFLYRSIFNKQHSYFYYAGFTMGLAFATHFVSIFIPLGMFLFLIFSTRYRKYITNFRPYLTLLIVIIMGFVAYSFKIDNGMFGIDAAQNIYSENLTRFSLQNAITLVGYQVFILMPVLYVSLWWILFKYSGRIFDKPNQINSELWYLLSFFLPLYLGFYMIAFFHFIPLNLAVPAYVSGIIFYGKFIPKRWIYINYVMIVLVHSIAYWHLFNKNYIFQAVETWIN